MLSSKVFRSGYEAVKNSEMAVRETNDCFVRALVNAFDVSYELAHEFTKEKLDRKKGKGTFGAREMLKNNNEITFKPEGQLNLFDEATEKKFNVEHLGDKPKVEDGKNVGGDLMNKKYKHKPVAFTVKTFMQRFKKGTFMVLVHKHALVIKDGVLIDNGNYRFEGFRRPVETAFAISK